MRLVAILAAALMLLSACAEPKWVHATKTQDDFHRDHYACQKDLAILKGNDEFSLGRRDFYASCMRARGWRDESN